MSTKIDKLTRTILTHLKNKGELGELRPLVEALMKTPEYRASVNEVVLTAATKLEPSMQKQIEGFIKKQVGADYALTTVVDPDLIAGFTLKINDTLIDASFLGKIETIEHTLQTKE